MCNRLHETGVIRPQIHENMCNAGLELNQQTCTSDTQKCVHTSHIASKKAVAVVYVLICVSISQAVPAFTKLTFFPNFELSK